MPPVLEVLRQALGAEAVRETHTAWVLLTRDRAYKLKKPVHFGFVDLSTGEQRRRVCEAEAEVNRALAPEIVIGVRAVLPDGALADPSSADAQRAVDWVVAMRRYDEARTMASRLAAGTLTPGDVDRAARRIARFHAVARPVGILEPAAAVVRATFVRNLDELAAITAPGRVGALREGMLAALAAHAAEIDARGAAGLVRDGHADLRAEHVVLNEGGAPVAIVDRLEFDPALRHIDVGADLAFLVMDLEELGAPWAADRLVATYRDAGGDPGTDGLIALFAAYWASVRAKVDLLRAGQLDAPREQAGELRLAGDELALAERLLWRARGPLVLLVAGPPASGKSSLAAALRARSGLPVAASDLVRKELLGLAATAPAPASAYATGERARVYAELGRRAAAARRGVIVDATFGDPAARSAFLDALGPADHDRLRVVTCCAPAEVLAERARRRAREEAYGSDAGEDVVARLAAAFVPFDAVPAARRLELDTNEPPAELAGRVAAWLDAADPAENYGTGQCVSPDGAPPRPA